MQSIIFSHSEQIVQTRADPGPTARKAEQAFCGYCGTAFVEQGWPRTCQNCGMTTYLNPIPVVVVLIPIDNGLLAIRRSTAPRKGEIALPGGFINFDESWQAAGAREVLEETGVVIEPEEIREYRIRSALDGTLLVFGIARKRASDKLPPFVVNNEASERLIITEPVPMAFALHAEMVKDFFFW